MHCCEFFTQNVWIWIFCSILFVSVALIGATKFYKKMFPGINLISTEVVLIPFRFMKNIRHILSSPSPPCPSKQPSPKI